jgi:hypothetical protein
MKQWMKRHKLSRTLDQPQPCPFSLFQSIKIPEIKKNFKKDFQNISKKISKRFQPFQQVEKW